MDIYSFTNDVKTHMITPMVIKCGIVTDKDFLNALNQAHGSETLSSFGRAPRINNTIRDAKAISAGPHSNNIFVSD